MTSSSTADGTSVRVVVIGAGYAGLIATNRLLSSLTPAEAARARVTVVNPRADFVERIRLHELAAGSRSSVLIPLADLLHRDAHLVIGTVERIDAHARTASLATPAGDVTEPYDFLIYAPGCAAATPVPGASDHAHLLADLEGAQTAATRLAGLGAGSRVVVIGGGFMGVEAATEIAERRPDLEVTLLSSGSVVQQMRPQAQRSIRRALGRLGVHLLEDATADHITSDAVTLADGRSLGFDCCLLALSFKAPDLARASGLPVDDLGRLRVDETLRSTEAPSIIGAGDAVVTPARVGAHLRMSCAAALPLGGHAADTLLHLMRGQRPTPISIGFVVQCISLGRRDGYIQLVRADDSPRRTRFTGRSGAWVKERICRLVVDGPKKERNRPGAYRTAKGPRHAVHAGSRHRQPPGDSRRMSAAYSSAPGRKAERRVTLALLAAVAAFQSALVAGAPWGAGAWGGRSPGVLPTPLRVGSAVSVVVYIAIGRIVASNDLSSIVRRRFLTGVSLVMMLGTAMNLASPSPIERLWAPLAATLAVTLWRARTVADLPDAGR